MTFSGWNSPESNYSKLPHQFIDSLPDFTSKSEICVVLYVLRHTWGYGDEYKRLSLDEFKNGRKRKDGTRIDNGTGLSVNAIKSGIKQAVEHGFLSVARDESDKARIKQYYSLSELDYQKLIPRLSKVDTQASKVDTRTKKETNSKKQTDKNKVVAPNGAFSPQPLLIHNSEKQSSPKPNGLAPIQEEACKLNSGAVSPDDILEAWGRLFPDKPQPRPATYRSKINTRLKSGHFREHWLVAMERAAESSTCQNESWFHFEFFIRNDENYVKCYNRWMAWMDKKLNQNGHSTNYAEMDADAEFARMNAHLPPLEDYDD